jgi:hypothetical protein
MGVLLFSFEKEAISDELNCQKKVIFVNSSQNEGSSPSGIALSFDGFGAAKLLTY